MLANLKRTFTKPDAFEWSDLLVKIYEYPFNNPARLYTSNGALFNDNGTVTPTADGKLDVWVRVNTLFKVALVNAAHPSHVISSETNVDPQAVVPTSGTPGGEEGGGTGTSNPNTVMKTFTLQGTTPVEVLRLPCPVGMGWQFSLALGVGDINSTPAQLFAAVPNSFFNEAGTFVYDGDWDSRWPVEASSPVRFSTLDLSADPVIDSTFMHAEQVGNELVITCEPTSELAIGPCAILFEGVRSDGSGFAPSTSAPVAALDTLAVVRTDPAGVTIPASVVPGEFRIPFTVVDTNNGGHFNTGVSTYVVPATGFYLIEFATRFFGAQATFVELRRNGTVVRSIGDVGLNVGSVILHATAGDEFQLWITYEAIDPGSKFGPDASYGVGCNNLSIVQIVDSAAGALPADTAKMLQTLQLAAPNWFSPPNLANSGLDILASSGRTVSVDLWMFQPWQSALVMWGDGQFSQLYMDTAVNPMPLGGQGTAAFAGIGVQHVYEADGTYQLEIIVMNAYGQDNYQEQFVFEPV